MGHLRNSSQKKICLKKTGLSLILMSELCHMGSSRNCCLVLICLLKFTSDQICTISCKNGSFTDIVFRVSCLFRLPVKTRLPPYFPSSSLKKPFYFPRLDSSRYFLIQVVLSDLLKEEMSIIFKPPLS